MKTIFKITFVAILLWANGCKEEDSNLLSPCETIANAHLSSFLQVENLHGSRIIVQFNSIPFSAIMNENACELTGLPTGSHSVEIAECLNQDCTQLNQSRTYHFSLVTNETYVITVNPGDL